jgi:NADH:ubiquinone oxidoreductase subunit F (NADH-binding)
MSVRIYISRDSGALCVGAQEVAMQFFKLAEQKGLDIEIVRTGSRGMYWLEPLVEVARPEGRVGYGPVKPSDVEELIGAGMLDGKAHRLSLGLVEEIPFFKSQTRLTFKHCGIVDPRSLEDYKAHGGYKGLAKAIEIGPEATVEEVVNSGLRGRGGAGFPTGIKWRTVAATPPQQKYIVCNADEGDSGTFADRMIMEGDPFVLIEGMTIAGIAVGASYGYVYIRSEYPDAVEAMEIAVRAARAGGMLGKNIAGSKYDYDMEVRMGAGAYVCGEETSLLESLEGKRGEVRAKPPLPAHVGLFGAYFPRKLFDTPFDYEAFTAADGLIGHGGIVVFDDTVDMAKQARFAMEFCAIESCGKCTPCRIGSTRGVELVDKIVAGENREANLVVLEDLCHTMKLGSLCALGGFTPYPVMSALTHFPEDFGAKKKRLEAAE